MAFFSSLEAKKTSYLFLADHFRQIDMRHSEFMEVVQRRIEEPISEKKALKDFYAVKKKEDKGKSPLSRRENENKILIESKDDMLFKFRQHFSGNGI